MKSPAGRLGFSFSGLLLLLAIMLTAGGITYGLAAAPNSIAPEKELPRIGTYDNLMKLLEKSQSQNVYYDRNTVKSEASAAVPQATGLGGGANADFSATNLQVEGVDEADLVKTDGSYIYQVNNDKVLIIKAEPADQMELVATIQFTDAAFRPAELYLDADNLIVIGSSSTPQAVPLGLAGSMVRSLISPPDRWFQSTQAIVYDIKNKNSISKIRELEMEGTYLSSRKIASSFYMLTNKYVNYYSIQRGEEKITPSWRDSVRGENFVAEKLEDICYFPNCISPNYLMVGAMDLSIPGSPANISTYLGSGEQIYASQNNLYVAIQKNDFPIQTWPDVTAYQAPQYSTNLYKFALQPGKVLYSGTGTVPGYVLNQFSMDENAGYLRIATTIGESWRTDQYASSNNVYVLNQDLQVCGKLENIAPGEKIYSTRFMGDRAYMVTFQQVDPFFVLDLKDPSNPVVLGKLKIPGYSDYLHPYDENHIIGFGKETVLSKGWNGQSQAFYEGMKIAVFDVTDVSNPLEVSRALIGDRGTDSELLRNHKALLFSAEKNLLAFPVTVMEVNNQSGQSFNQIPAYGTFTYQGLYVYSIDLAKGLQYRGRITHLSSEDYLKAGDAWYDTNKNIERALYVGDTLYTLSSAMIKANNIFDLSAIKTLNLPYTESGKF